METYLNWFIRYLSIIFLLSFASLTQVYASEPLATFLTNDIFLTDQSIIFEMQLSHAESIAALRIFYLSSDDCQSGYAGLYDTSSQSPAFPIMAMTPFGLNAGAVYLAGVRAIGHSQIEKINSILIRLQGNNRQFARFIGSCNDQKINCCVPVDCSTSTGICLSKHPMGTQVFMLSSS